MAQKSEHWTLYRRNMKRRWAIRTKAGSSYFHIVNISITFHNVQSLRDSALSNRIFRTHITTIHESSFKSGHNVLF